MDVRCERCRAQYVFDDEQVTPSGLAVQCTRCGHVFRVKKKELVVTVPVKPGELDGVPLPATAAAPRPGGGRVAEHGSAPAEAERRAWRVRRASGDVLALHEPSALQRWVVERRVSRDDELSEAGGPWRRLGDLAELEAFFQVVEAAARTESLSKNSTSSQADPRERGGGWGEAPEFTSGARGGRRPAPPG
ncbi:zinc-ribbon domain-containing protein, partial [Anaeromyxobacter oryzisoli]|uniref:zinc-ribbon domain-containing protein n=1 Tax=Anaeromyxobacter oryzisoli TaxID=2925408 RepID=UPI001F575EBC